MAKSRKKIREALELYQKTKPTRKTKRRARKLERDIRDGR